MLDFKQSMDIITLMNERSITNLRIYMVYLCISENAGCTSKQIADYTKINSISLCSMLLTLKRKGFIKSVDNERDTTKNILRQQVYFICDELIKTENS